MAFPDDELGTKVELKLGTTWTDITPDVKLGQLITVTRGRADGASQVGPSKTTLALKNPDGKYSPRNPVGPYYGLIGRNTPLRVSVVPGGLSTLYVPDGEPVNATTPDNAVLDITGDIDIRVDVAPALWGDLRADLSGFTDLVTKYGASGQRSWYFGLTETGNLILFWSADGTAVPRAQSTVPVPFVPGQRGTVRVAFDVNNGSGGNTATFYTSTTPGVYGPWTQLGDPVVQTGTTSIFNSTAPIEIGTDSPSVLARRYYAVQVRNGIDGTIVADPDFTLQAVGTTSFTDDVSRPWTASAGAITNRDTRIVNEVPAWPVRWAPTDQAPAVSLEAAGILRRLGQGSAPLDSTLRRRIPAGANIRAYWPMEDGQASSRAYSPIAGVAPMSVKGLNFASDDSLSGSSALPTVSVPAWVTASVPVTPVGDWWVEMVYRIDSVPASPILMFTVNLTGGSAAQIQFFVGVGVSRVRALAADGTVLSTTDFTLNNFTDNWGRLQFYTSTSGSTVSYFAQWVVIGAPSNWFVTNTFTGTPGRVASVQGAWSATEFNSLRIGHLSVFPGPLSIATSIYQAADIGFAGESAPARLQRLAFEEGVPLLTTRMDPSDTVMGAQRPNALLALFQESADADSGGILYEPRDHIGLAFRARWTLYNQPVALALSYSNGLHEVAPPLEPEDDDQATVNDVTVTRASGSSGHQTLDEGPLSTQDPPDGVGRYPTSITLNLNDDDQPDQHAAWRLHVGTYDGVRYPAVTVNLARAPHLIAAASGVDIGDRITISDPPVWLPPDTIDLIVQGITETVGIRTWRITYLCVPAGPWTVGVREDAVLSHRGSAGSQLAAAVGVTDTLLPVLVTAGQPWVTTASQPTAFPFDIQCGGEVMTVTGIGGSVVDGCNRTTTSGWGSSDTGQAWTTSGGSTSDYSVQGV